MSSQHAKLSKSSLHQLREEVLEANLELVRRGLVLYTFGNASGIDREKALVVIKPSGVPYSKMKPEHLVVSDLNGKTIEGKLRPSSDLPTHLVPYKAFPEIGGVVHTHSEYATAWAQARREIPCFGTTHADNFHGEIPITRDLQSGEVEADYELNTGRVIVERFREGKIDPANVPGVLVASHAPFAWGPTPEKAVENAIVLEFAAQMALAGMAIAPDMKPIPKYLLDKHFLRKHGPTAYYGQPKA